MSVYDLNYYSREDLYKAFAKNSLYYYSKDGQTDRVLLKEGDRFINGDNEYLIGYVERAGSVADLESKMLYKCAYIGIVSEENSYYYESKDTFDVTETDNTISIKPQSYGGTWTHIYYRVLFYRSLVTEYGEAINAACYLKRVVKDLDRFLRQKQSREYLPNIGDDIRLINDIENHPSFGEENTDRFFYQLREITGRLNYILGQYNLIKKIAEKYGYLMPHYESESKWTSPGESGLSAPGCFEERIRYLSQKASAEPLLPTAEDTNCVFSVLPKSDTSSERSSIRFHININPLTVILVLIGIAGVVGGILMTKSGIDMGNERAAEQGFFDPLITLLLVLGGPFLVILSVVWIIVSIKITRD